MADQPWYVRALVWVGAPVAAAGYLLWWILGTFASQQATHHVATQELQRAITAMTSELQRAHSEDVLQARNALDQAWSQLSVMQRICLNTAKTDNDKVACATLTPRGGDR